MAAISERQLVAYLKQAGFPDERIPLMVNIAKRESGLNPLAHNPNRSTGDNSYGLFQINMIDNLGSARLKEYADLGVRSYEDLKDPWKNVQAAKRVFDSQGINAWTTAKAAAGDPAPAVNMADVAPLIAGSDQSGDPLEAMVNSLVAGSLGEAAQKQRPDGSKAAGLGFIENLHALDPGTAAQVAAVTALLPKPTSSAYDREMSSAPVDAGLQGRAGETDIVSLGKQLQGLGLKVAEHPAFGGVGKHSPNSQHYRGKALDLTIQPGSPLLQGRPDSDWRALTQQIGARLKKAIPGAEIFHPGDDPVGGHDSHIHFALPSGRAVIAQDLAQLLRV
ncbi:MAG: hypothetical protein EBZ24_12315 [Synechococcaceae bacterium WB9_4xB_025]|nr:hypothetical protein [Synechococcaceae bacterium WB9_4xB_025]